MFSFYGYYLLSINYWKTEFFSKVKQTSDSFSYGLHQHLEYGW